MKKEIPTITTSQFLIRDFIESDQGYVYNGLSNPEVIKYYGISFNSFEATKEQMSWFKQPEQFWWAICPKNNNQFFGAVGLNAVSLKHKKAEIGIWLLPEYWGKGIMTEVMPLVCNFGFKKLGLHRIEGFVESENYSCKKAMEKLEFKHEGRMKDCEIKNGKFISIDIYAKLNK